jgi:hypothetical protein
LRIHRCIGQAVAVTYPLDEIGGTEPDEAPTVSRRRAIVILLSAALMALLVGLVAVVELHGFGGRTNRSASRQPPVAATHPAPGADTPLPVDTAPPSGTPTGAIPTPAGTHKATPTPNRPGATSATGPGAPAPAPPGPTTPPPGGCAACAIPGDATVPVGGADPKAVRAGTYHSDGPTRADGCSWWLATDEQGEDQNAGRTVDHATDVIVRDGLWFHSEGCQNWRWVAPV